MTLHDNKYFAPFPLFLAAALFILASPVFWMGVEAPGRDRPGITSDNADLHLEIAPAMQYGFSRLRAGEMPLWNDRQLCGVPFFANPVHGLLQPLNVGFLVLDTPRALALHGFLSLSLMGFFTVLLLRAMGTGYVSAALGGMVYMCCGAVAAAMSRPGIANVLVWMPLLCCVLRSHAHKPRLLSVVSGGCGLAFLWLSGAPMISFGVTLFCAAYALALGLFGVEADATPNNNVAESILSSRLGGLLAMLLMALGLTAVQWIPTLAWARTLDAPLAFFTRFAVPGRMPTGHAALLTQLLQPRSGTLPALGYVGVSTLLLLPAAFFHRIPRWERSFFALSAALLWLGALAFANGASDAPWTALVYPAVFAVALLAGLGADRLFMPRRTTLTPRLWGPLVLVGVVFLVLFLVAPAATRGRMAPVLLALGTFAIFRTRWASVLSGVILLLLLFVDLSAASSNYGSHPFFTSAVGIPLSEETKADIRDVALEDRVMISAAANSDLIHPSVGLTDGVRVAGGAGYPLTPAQAIWWQALTGHPVDADTVLDVSADSPHALLLNLMAARAVVVAQEGGLATGSAPGLRLRRRGEAHGVTVYENENVAPRFSWATAWRLALDLPAVMAAIGETDFDPRHECVVLPDASARSHLARTVPDGRGTPGQAPTDGVMMRTHIVAHEDTPERLVVSVENAAPGILVVSDTLTPGWRAYVDGQRVPILATNGLFRGIVLGPGTHTVLFQYRPQSVIAGGMISIGALCIVMLVVMVVPIMRRR